MEKVREMEFAMVKRKPSEGGQKNIKVVKNQSKPLPSSKGTAQINVINEPFPIQLQNGTFKIPGVEKVYFCLQFVGFS